MTHCRLPVMAGFAALAAIILGSGCASIHVPPRIAPAQCVVDPSITGTWTDTRMTQLGPAWSKLSLGCDCSATYRAQLLWMRITMRQQYRAMAGQLLRDTANGRTTAWPYRLEGNVLSITEAPGEVITYTRSATRSCAGS
ncbi:MAG: hypothetical protein WD690_15525 [Vicinamibacterales bacterium]